MCADNTDIDQLPPLKEIIREHDLRADKKFGQNFLLDQNLTDKIVRLCGTIDETNIIEIGPGPGGLTRSLLRHGAKSVYAAELDPRAVAALQSLREAAVGKLHILSQDALKLDIRTIAGPRAIIANLPYNIATALLIGWLRIWHEAPEAISFMALMFQKEVAERITAKPNTKAYGRLSVLAQWLCDTKIIMKLPPNAFTPPPKIHSAIVHFKRKECGAQQPAFETLSLITEKAFGQRRKMLRSSLKDYLVHLERCGIDPAMRAEDLSPENYVALARSVDNSA